MQYPNAWTLLSIVAYRGRRSSATMNPHGLALGEALIGDFESYGMTEKGYRVAKKQLEKWGIAAFKGANKGTIAKLVDNSIYDINVDAKGEQQGEQRGERGATNEERKKERKRRS